MASEKRSYPPPLSRRLLRLLLPRGALGQSILADLDDEFDRLVEEQSGRRARSWYRRQGRGVMLAYAIPGRLRRMLGEHESIPGIPPNRPAAMLARVSDDTRYAVRTLLREPAWSAAVVATLALAIGATTAIFSFVDRALLRPLDYDAPEELATLEFFSAAAGADATGLDEGARRHESSHTTFPNFLEWRATTTDVFQEIAAFDDAWTYTMRFPGGSSRLPGTLVSASLFRALRAAPLLGRTFADEEDGEGSDDTIVLGYGLWQRQFGGGMDIVGSVVSVNEIPHKVIGVMPEDFVFPSRSTEFWLPLARASRGSGSWNYEVLVRMREGVDMARANVLLRDRGVGQTGRVGAEERWTAAARPLREYFVGDVRPQLIVFSTAVAALLLLACVNVAHLMLTRSAGRAKEHVVRAAMGAGRTRLAQQLLTESIFLSLTGGVLGLALANLLARSLLALGPATLPHMQPTGIDGKALAFTFGVCMSVGIAIGVLPALRAANTSLAAGLNASGRATGSARQNRIRDGLVVVQTAMAMALLVCAGLLLRSFLALLAVEQGFDPRNVLTFETSLPRSIYTDPVDRVRFYDALLDELARQPGVRSAGLVLYLPAAGQFHSTGFEVPGYVAEPGESPSAEIKEVSPGYFAALGVGLVRGRMFDARDDAEAPPVAIINEALARRYWQGREAVGQRLRLGETDVEVVGVVNDVRYRAGGRDHGEADDYQLYRPYAAATNAGDMDVLVRTDAAPAQLVPAVHRIMRSLDPEVTLFGIMSVEERLAERVAEPRFRMLLLGSFGLAALLLAAIGIYGVMAYAVGQRTREVGIRMAVGAPTNRIFRQVMGRGLALALVGLAFGALGAYVATNLLESFLYQLGTHDPASFAMGSLVLLVTAGLASAIPAYKASRVDPIIALRAE